ncbi:MAG: ABC transporter substrate-binding protein [Opitutaceae bacterium]|nr:ABC transporter substrate-binding protein [Opitutaceae bacterium]
MKISRFLNFPVALAAAVLASAGVSRADEPESILRRGVDEVMAVVYDPAPASAPLSVRVKPVLEKYFDFAGITRRAVGPSWKQLSSAQQHRAIDLFGEIVLRTYADRFQPREKPTISYGAVVELSARRRELAQTVGYLGQNYSVAYRMEQQASGGWLVYDVLIEGVSMVQNYRGQFEAILQKGGPEALLKSLEDNLRDIASKTT